MDLRKSARINDRGKKRKNLLQEKALKFAADNCRLGIDFDGFQVRHINEVIGHGVFTTKVFKEGDFLLHYDGDLLSNSEARKKRRSYDPSIGNFQYEFRYREKRLCIDATENTLTTARMANDAPSGHPLENSFMAVVVVDKVPHLCLFAKRDIETGEELRYDYGDPTAPWRKKNIPPLTQSSEHKRKVLSKAVDKEISPTQILEQDTLSKDVKDGASPEMTKQGAMPPTATGTIHDSTYKLSRPETGSMDAKDCASPELTKQGAMTQTATGTIQDSTYKLANPETLSKNAKEGASPDMTKQGAVIPTATGTIQDSTYKLSRPETLTKNVKEGASPEMTKQGAMPPTATGTIHDSTYILSRPDNLSKNVKEGASPELTKQRAIIPTATGTIQDSTYKISKPETLSKDAKDCASPKMMKQGEMTPTATGTIQDSTYTLSRPETLSKDAKDCTSPEMTKQGAKTPTATGTIQDLTYKLSRQKPLSKNAKEEATPELTKQGAMPPTATETIQDSTYKLSRPKTVSMNSKEGVSQEITKQRAMIPTAKGTIQDSTSKLSRPKPLSKNAKEDASPEMTKQGAMIPTATGTIQDSTSKIPKPETLSKNAKEGASPDMTKQGAMMPTATGTIQDSTYKLSRPETLSKNVKEGASPEMTKQEAMIPTATETIQDSTYKISKPETLSKNAKEGASPDMTKQGAVIPTATGTIQDSTYKLSRPETLSKNVKEGASPEMTKQRAMIPTATGTIQDSTYKVSRPETLYKNTKDCASPDMTKQGAMTPTVTGTIHDSTSKILKPETLSKDAKEGAPHEMAKQGAMAPTATGTIPDSAYKISNPENLAQTEKECSSLAMAKQEDWSLTATGTVGYSISRTPEPENVPRTEKDDPSTEMTLQVDMSLTASGAFEYSISKVSEPVNLSQAQNEGASPGIMLQGDMPLTKERTRDDSEQTLSQTDTQYPSQEMTLHGDISPSTTGTIDLSVTVFEADDTLVEQQAVCTDENDEEAPIYKPTEPAVDSPVPKSAKSLPHDNWLHSIFKTDRNKKVTEKCRKSISNYASAFPGLARGKGKRSKCDYAKMRDMLQDDYEDEIVGDSGSEYVPSEVEDSTSGEESEEIPYPSIERALVKKTTMDISSGIGLKRTVENSSRSIIPFQLLEEANTTSMAVDDSHTLGQQTIEDILDRPSANEATVKQQTAPSTVQHGEESVNNPSIATTNNDGKRKHDKRFYCLYCLKPQTKLKRHLTETKEHQNEEEVVKLKALEDDKEKERILLTKLRNIGNYLHNKKVMKDGKGELNVRYRPKQSETEKVDTYGACPYCYGYYKIKYLWRHRCPLKPEVPKQPGKKQRIASKSRIITPQIGVSSGSILQSVISRMRMDEVSRIIKSDKTIMALAEKLCSHLSEDIDEHTETRQSLRRMGRLLRQLRNDTNSPNKTLVDFIDPQCFRLVCNAVRNMSEFIPSTNRYRTPSLAQKIGPMIEKICDMLTTEGIEKQDSLMQQKVADFKKLYDLNWSESVSRNASKTLAEEKRKKATSSLLPMADDVKLLSNYLENKAKQSYEILHGDPTTEEKQKAWLQLSESVLTHTILFSRRRAGEVSKMTLNDYEKKTSADVDGPVAETLTQLERKLCTIMKRTIVKGKRGRPVAVLFNQQMVKYIDCLIDNREEFVDSENTYLFARYAPSLGHIRGTDTMRESAKACGAERPKTLRSTTLRKQIATLSQVMNLKENELDVLARFLGHDIRVHREYYRLTDETIQVAKVAKLLINMEKGGHGLLPGQTLDTLEIESVLTDDEQDGDENVVNDNDGAGVNCDDDDDDDDDDYDDDDEFESTDEEENDNEEDVGDIGGIDGNENETENSEQHLPKGSKRRRGKDHSPERNQTRKRSHRNAKQPLSENTDEIEKCISGVDGGEKETAKNPKRRNDKEHIPDIKQKRQRRHPYSYRPWSQDERDAVFKHFHRSIVLQKLPGKADYLLCLQEEDALKTRTWLNLKDFVRNQFGKY